MNDFFVPDPVLLHCDRVRDRRYRVDNGIGADYGVETLISDVNVHVLELERCIIAGGASIFAWLQQTEECNGDHIRYSLGVVVMGRAIGLCDDKYDHDEGNWLDSFGGESSLLRVQI
jgi:hypothetical protein